MNAIVITVDARGSGGSVAGIERIQRRLSAAPVGDWLLPFTPTVGDEIQAVAGDPVAVCDAIQHLAREACWIGIGIGIVDELRSEARLSGGPAFDMARSAIERANARQGRGRRKANVDGVVPDWPLAVGHSDPDTARVVEYALALHWSYVHRRTDRQHAIAVRLDTASTQAQIAHELGIGANVVSKSMAGAAYQESNAARQLAQHAIREALGAE